MDASTQSGGVLPGHGQALEDASWAALYRSGLLPQFLVLCFAIWLHAANSMLAATTLPSAVAELGGANLISWAFTLYLLGSILAGAAAGLLVKRIGLRTGMLGAAVLYGLASALCAIAWQMEVVLAGRLLQGLGGGMLLALTYVALNRNFPADLMPRLLALISAVWSASAFCGPLIGGTFATYGLWRYGYWAFAVQAAIFIAWALLAIRESSDPERTSYGRLPVLRLGVLTLAIMLVAFAGASVDGVVSPFLCAVSLALIWIMLRMDSRKSDSRMFPAYAINVRMPAGAGLFMVFTLAGATMSFLVYGPILLETLYGLTPLMTGYVIALEAVSWGVAAIVFSGSREAAEPWLIRAGTALVSLGVVGFAFAMPADGLWAVILCAIAQGAGFGMMWGFVVRRIVSHTPAQEKDLASSSIPTVQQIALAVGAAVAGIVANAAGFAEGVSLEAAREAAYWVFIAFVPLAVLANVAAWRLTR